MAAAKRTKNSFRGIPLIAWRGWGILIVYRNISKTLILMLKEISIEKSWKSWFGFESFYIANAIVFGGLVVIRKYTLQFRVHELCFIRIFPLKKYTLWILTQNIIYEYNFNFFLTSSSSPKVSSATNIDRIKNFIGFPNSLICSHLQRISISTLPPGSIIPWMGETLNNFWAILDIFTLKQTIWHEGFSKVKAVAISFPDDPTRKYKLSSWFRFKTCGRGFLDMIR